MLPDPVILGHKIHWYLLFHYTGLVAAIIFSLYYYRKRHYGHIAALQLFVLLSATIFLMLYGARLAGVCEAYVSTGEWHWDLVFLPPSQGRFRWAGAVAALFLFVPLVGKTLRIKHFFSYFDVMAISVCLLTAFSKQGCLFSGDGCYGIPTNLPWGMYFPYGPAPNVLPVHPTPIYDSLFHLVLFIGLIFWDSRHKQYKGQTALLYFILTPTFYLLLEVIRINPRSSFGMTVPQIFYLFVLLAALAFYLMRRFSFQRVK